MTRHEFKVIKGLVKSRRFPRRFVAECRAAGISGERAKVLKRRLLSPAFILLNFAVFKRADTLLQYASALDTMSDVLTPEILLTQLNYGEATNSES